MESWKTELLEEFKIMAEKNISELGSIMNSMGIDNNLKSKWIEILKEQVQESFMQILNEAKTYQNNLIDSIEELLQQCEEFCKRLRIKMPSYGSHNLNLSEEKNLLKSKILEYEAKIKERIEEINELRKRLKTACKSLGYEPITIQDTPVLPTMEEIDNFAKYVEKLENEKFQRETKFLEIKCKILDIVNELGIEPSLEIEKTVCSPDDSLFLVTDYNMKWIVEYYESLIQQKKQTEHEISTLREKITNLWEILAEDIKDTNTFLQKYTGNSLATLKALQNEVKRCENIKKTNIEKFVKKMREELIILWDKCHISTSERAEFEYFSGDLYTEDLLTFHDIEIEKMKKYYEENKEILIMLEKRKEYWKRKLELEERANDPNRYKNRGGTLLKEERERNGITKKICDIELELLEFAQKYEEQYCKPFLSWGEAIPDLIEATNNEYENNKKQQLSAKKQQRNLTPTPSKTGYLPSTISASKRNLLTPCMSGITGSVLSGNKRNLLTLTPNAAATGTPSTAKRKLPPTHLFSNKKKTPMQENASNKNRVISKITTDKLNAHQKKLRYSHERKKRLAKIRRLSNLRQSLKKSKERNESMDYNDFERGVSEKESCRSTFFHEPSTSLAQQLPATPNKNLLHIRTPTCKRLKAIPGSNMDI